MKSLEARIREAYTRYPQANGRQILAMVGCKDTARFWQVLADVQNRLRGYSAGQRKNHNAHPARTVGE